jgi:ubiquinone biosynthesis protein
MSEQVGMRGLRRNFEREAPYLARILPQMPRLIHQSLAREPAPDLQPLLERLIATQERQTRWLALIAVLLGSLVALLLY